MKKIVSFVTLIITIFTTILLNDGLLSLQQVKSSRVCKCNHSSNREVHSDRSLLFEEHSDISVVSDKLPTCHTQKKGEPHLCSCKKSSDTLETIFFQKSPIIQNKIEIYSFLPNHKEYYSIPFDRLILPAGFNFLITPPPKPTI